MNNVNNIETNGETGQKEQGSAWDKLKNIPFLSRKAEAPEETKEEVKEKSPEDKIREEINDEIDSLGNEIFDKQGELRELHKKIEAEGEPDGTYREVGGDVYDNRVEVGQNVKDAAIALSKEIGRLEERKKDLLNPRIQEAEIKRRIEEQEQQKLDQKAFDAALHVPRLETRLLAFDQQIQKLEDAGNEEAAENVRKAKQLFIEQEMIPVGRGLLEKQQKGELNADFTPANSETAEGEAAENVEEDVEETPEESTVEAGAEKEHKTLFERYEESANARAKALPTKEAYSAFSMDQVRVRSLNGRLKRLSETSTAGMSARELRKHLEAVKEVEAELYKYGKRGGENGRNTMQYDLLNSQSPTAINPDTISYGQRRMKNFSILESSLKGDAKRVVKKTLKRHGIKKFPESWNDRDFSAQDVEKMSEYAKMALRQYEEGK